MKYSCSTLYGKEISSPSESEMFEIISSVINADDEHTDVSIKHESEWCLSVFKTGKLVLENVETGEGPWNMVETDLSEILKLWVTISTGDINTIKLMQWNPGY